MDMSLHRASNPLPRRTADHRLLRPVVPLIFFAAFLALPSSALATIYRVGFGDACTHPTLASAVAAAVADGSFGSHTIRVRSGDRNINNLNIDNPLRDITIHGGFAECEDDTPTPGNRTGLNATTAGSRVLRINNNNGNGRRFITLRNISITNGSNPTGTPAWGGGVLVQGQATLILEDQTRIEGNSASNGGGVALFNITTNPDNFTKLLARGSTRICDNAATGTTSSNGLGGGIFGGGGTEITLEDAEICENEARLGGGGVALLGTNDTLALGPTGPVRRVRIAGNTAGRTPFAANEGFGGGIYSKFGDITYSNNFTSATRRGSVEFNGNLANFGGGLYVEGPADASGFTIVELRNVLFANNRAEATGGGLQMRNAVDARLIKWGNGACSPDFSDSPFPCVDLFSNRAFNQGGSASFGAGGFAHLSHEDDAPRPALRIAGAMFESNNDVNGTAAVIEAQGNSSVRILRSVFVNNSAGGEAAFRALIESRSDTLFGFNTVLANNVTRMFFQGGAATEIDATGSILHSPGATVIFPSGSLVHNNCLLSHTTATMPPGVLVAEPNLGPGFVPRPRSAAVDYCANGVGDNFWDANRDAYRTVAPINVPGVVNLNGAFDLGAVEQADVVFYGGFGVRPNN